MAVSGSTVRIGQELTVAATQTDFDKHFRQPEQYVKSQLCYVWVLDFKSCIGTPDSFAEPLKLPNPGAGTKVWHKLPLLWDATYHTQLKIAGISHMLL